MKRILSKKKDKKEAKEHKKPIFVDVNGSMGMTQTERDVLDIHFPKLQKTLNTKNVLKHLRRNGEVGDREEEFILQKKNGKSSKEDQVLMLTDYLKRRGDGFTVLVTALLQSKSQDHLAKALLRDPTFTAQEISEQLAKVEKRLDESQKGKLLKFRAEALTNAQGPPLKPERNDSLLTDSESEYSVSVNSFPGGSLHHDDSGIVNTDEMFEDKPVFENSLESGDDTHLLENILRTLSTNADTEDSIPTGWTDLHSTGNEVSKNEMKATSTAEDKDYKSQEVMITAPTAEDKIPSSIKKEDSKNKVTTMSSTEDKENKSHDQEAMLTAPTAEDEIPASIKLQEKKADEIFSFENGGAFRKTDPDQDETEKHRVRHASLQDFPDDFYGTAAVRTNEEPEEEVKSDPDANNASEGKNRSDVIFHRRNTFPRIKFTETTRERRGVPDEKVRNVLQTIKELRESTQHLQEKLQGENRRLHHMRYNTHRLLGVMY